MMTLPGDGHFFARGRVSPATMLVRGRSPGDGDMQSRVDARLPGGGRWLAHGPRRRAPVRPIPSPPRGCPGMAIGDDRGPPPLPSPASLPRGRHPLPPPGARSRGRDPRGFGPRATPVASPAHRVFRAASSLLKKKVIVSPINETHLPRLLSRSCYQSGASLWWVPQRYRVAGTLHRASDPNEQASPRGIHVHPPPAPTLDPAGQGPVTVHGHVRPEPRPVRRRRRDDPDAVPPGPGGRLPGDDRPPGPVRPPGTRETPMRGPPPASRARRLGGWGGGRVCGEARSAEKIETSADYAQ